MRRALLFGLLFFLSLFSIPANAQSRIDEYRAAAELQKMFSFPDPGLPIGFITVTANNPNTWKRIGEIKGAQTNIEMGEYYYKQLQVLENMGVVTIVHDAELQRFKSGQSFDFKTFSDRNNGLIDRLKVEVAEQYRQYLNSDGWIITLPKGDITSVKIVRVDYQKIGIENYAAVFFTFHANWHPLYLAFWKGVSGIQPGPDRKGIRLMKLDSFSNEWKPEPIGMDIANIDQPFRFNFVQNKLLQLSTGIPR